MQFNFPKTFPELLAVGTEYMSRFPTNEKDFITVVSKTFTVALAETQNFNDSIAIGKKALTGQATAEELGVATGKVAEVAKSCAIASVALVSPIGILLVPAVVSAAKGIGVLPKSIETVFAL